LPPDSARQLGAPPVAEVNSMETKLPPDEMAAIVARTLDHYDERADAFW